jgi:hypothetical protein
MLMATKKERRKKHLNETKASIRLGPGNITVVVKIPWDDIRRRLGVDVKTGHLSKKR